MTDVSPRYAPFQSDCSGKVPFTDPALARKAAARRKGRTIYRCRFCRTWHVGTAHKPARGNGKGRR